MRQPAVVTRTLSSIEGAAEQQHLLACELGVVLADACELLVDAGDELGHVVGLEHRLTDRGGLVLPRLEERVRPGLRDRRRDGRQLGVGVLVEPGVGGDDQVGLQRRDLVDLDAVVEVEHHWLRAAQFGLRPRPYAERLAAEPVGDRDRDDADAPAGRPAR